MEEVQLRVVVVGATGLIGSRTVPRLRDHGVEVSPVSRTVGVNAITTVGLDAALRGADVIVDVTDAPSREESVSTRFFGTATGNLLETAAVAGAEHYVVLSVVGADRVGSGYFQAKAAQEALARRSTVPHSVVRATPFFESVETAAHHAIRTHSVHVPPLLTRPVSADDIATAVAHIAVGVPLFSTVEFAGPEEHRLDELAAKLLASRGEPRTVVPDERAPFLGAVLGRRTLLPRADAEVGHTTFSHWLERR